MPPADERVVNEEIAVFEAANLERFVESEITPCTRAHFRGDLESWHGTLPLVVEQYDQTHLRGGDVAWHVHSSPACLYDVLPARPAAVDGKILAFHFDRHFSRRRVQVVEHQAGQSALDQLHHKP